MKDGGSPVVTLIVVNYRSGALTRRLLERAAGGADEILVVDNTPGDAALDELRGESSVTVVDTGRNLGYGAGANLAAAKARGDVLVVANPDVLVDGPALRRLAARAVGVGVVGPQVRFPGGRLQRSAHRREPLVLATLYETCAPLGGVAARLRPDWHPTLHSTSDHSHEIDASHLLGALLAIDAGAYRAVGGFDERFFLYREETDLCRRLTAAGYRVVYDPSVEAEHISGASSSDDWPLVSRPVWLESHYQYIRLHRGPARATVARVCGTAGAALTMVQSSRRAAGRRTLRWHLGLPVA